MALKLYKESSVDNVADAIRLKNGLSNKYKFSEMSKAVDDIKDIWTPNTFTTVTNLFYHGARKNDAANIIKALERSNIINWTDSMFKGCNWNDIDIDISNVDLSNVPYHRLMIEGLLIFSCKFKSFKICKVPYNFEFSSLSIVNLECVDFYTNWDCLPIPFEHAAGNSYIETLHVPASKLQSYLTNYQEEIAQGWIGSIVGDYEV